MNLIQDKIINGSNVQEYYSQGSLNRLLYYKVKCETCNNIFILKGDSIINYFKIYDQYTCHSCTLRLSSKRNANRIQNTIFTRETLLKEKIIKSNIDYTCICETCKKQFTMFGEVVKINKRNCKCQSCLDFEYLENKNLTDEYCDSLIITKDNVNVKKLFKTNLRYRCKCPDCGQFHIERFFYVKNSHDKLYCRSCNYKRRIEEYKKNVKDIIITEKMLTNDRSIFASIPRYLDGIIEAKYECPSCKTIHYAPFYRTFNGIKCNLYCKQCKAKEKKKIAKNTNILYIVTKDNFNTFLKDCDEKVTLNTGKVYCKCPTCSSEHGAYIDKLKSSSMFLYCEKCRKAAFKANAKYISSINELPEIGDRYQYYKYKCDTCGKEYTASFAFLKYTSKLQCRSCLFTENLNRSYNFKRENGIPLLSEEHIAKMKEGALRKFGSFKNLYTYTIDKLNKERNLNIEELVDVPQNVEKNIDSYINRTIGVENSRVIYKNGKFISKCLLCGNEEEITDKNKVCRCRKCFNKAELVSAVYILNNYIKELGFETELKCKFGKYTADIYIKSENIVVNFISLGFNTDSKSDKKIIWRSIKYYKSIGIKPIHIHEIDFHERLDAIKIQLKHELNKDTKIENAYSLRVQKIEYDDAIEFYNKYESVKRTVTKNANYGLVDDSGNIIAMATIMKSIVYKPEYYKISYYTVREDYKLKNGIEAIMAYFIRKDPKASFRLINNIFYNSQTPAFFKKKSNSRPALRIAYYKDGEVILDIDDPRNKNKSISFAEAINKGYYVSVYYITETYLLK